ncbi:MAG: SRPBCC family protein [Halobacteriaceae archaeon]
MHSMRLSKEMPASAEDVWEVLDDFENLQRYSPKNTTATLMEGPETGIGATRETTLADGTRIVHEIIEYEPGGTVYD